MTRRDTARVMAALALVASFTPTLVRRRRGDQALVSAGAAAMGAAAGAGTEWLIMRLADRVDGEDTARAVVVAVGAVASAAELSKTASSPVALLATGARVAAVAALVGGLTPVREAEPRRLGASGWALLAGTAGCGFVVWKRTRPRRPGVHLRRYPAERRLATVSGGEGSLLPWEELDFEGTRFLATAVHDAARDPIRVFAGVRHAATVDERCDLAVRELERLGGLERRRIVVWSATLRGYVNPVPVAAEEHLSDGDVASVVVQYHDRRTLLMPLKVPIAARTHRALLERLPTDGPEIVVYGESLGAWASQNVFRREGLRALEGLRVSRALWVGTPFFSRLKRRLRGEEGVAFVQSEDLTSGDVSIRPRFVFFERRNDPVVLFSGLELIWRRPAWLPEDLRRHWQPGITFLQLVADLFNATNRIGLEPRAAAHDYRVELPLAVDLAFGHRAPRARVEALGRRLVEEEVARGRRLRAIRRGELDVSSG